MKKFLLSLAALLAIGGSATAETKTYQLCTDEAEILNPDNQFILVSSPYNGAIYAAKNGGDGISILSSSTQPAEIAVDADAKGLGLFSIKTNGENKVLYENGTKKYFTYTTAKFSPVASINSTDAKYQITVEINPTSHAVTMTQLGNTSTVYQIGFNSGQYFRNYKQSTLSGGGQYCYPLFYKEVTSAGAIDPSYSGYETEGYTLELGETLSLEGKILPKELTYTFTSSDPSVVAVDNDTKTFTALAPGTATINFSTEAIADKFNEGRGSFTITVTKIAPELSFADQIIIGKYPVGVVWQPVTITKPTDHEGLGQLVYTSSDESIITINAETGQITPDDVHAAGEVTITATLKESESYAEASAEYKIILKDPAGEIQAGTSKFDFTTENPYGMTTTNSSSTYEKKVKEILADGVTTITFEGDYRSWKKTSGGNTSYELRVNKGADSKFTINVPEGYTISAIGMVGGKIAGSYTPAGETSDEIKNEENPDEWDSDVKLTWHAGAEDTNVNHVEFDNSNTDTAQISTIWVQYQPTGVTLESADLSFGKVVNNILMEEEATINAVRNPNNREVSYKIANLSEDEYVITPSEDGKTLKVLVMVPGFYTLEATSPAGDGYRDGYAIMRLNVYRHLDVYANDVEITDETIDTEEDVTVTFRVPDFAKVYWQIIDDANPTAPDATPTDDEDQEAGFELYEDEINIDKGLNGKLIFYIANYGYASPKRTILLGDAEEVPVPEIEQGDDFNIDGNYITGEGPIKIRFKAIDGYHIYYSLDANAARRNVKAKATRACDNHEGFQKHEGEEITLSEKHSALSFYACNPETGVHSNLTTYNLSLRTGVIEIEVSEENGAIYFNLQGVEIANPEKGIYIRVKDGKASKVMVK